MAEKIQAVVLAAGKGTRLQTEGIDLPKVLREADGKPLLHYVLKSLNFLPKEDTILVVGWMGDKVRKKRLVRISIKKRPQPLIMQSGKVFEAYPMSNSIRFIPQEVQNRLP